MKAGRRGFTLMEAVVAIAVVVIVSFAAMTLALSSVRAEERAVRLNEVSILAENAVECYRAAGDDVEAFKKLMVDSKNGEKVTSGGNTVTLARRGYTVIMAISDGGIVITAEDEDGKEFYELKWPG